MSNENQIYYSIIRILLTRNYLMLRLTLYAFNDTPSFYFIYIPTIIWILARLTFYPINNTPSLYWEFTNITNFVNALEFSSLMVHPQTTGSAIKVNELLVIQGCTIKLFYVHDEIQKNYNNGNRCCHFKIIIFSYLNVFCLVNLTLN